MTILHLETSTTVCSVAVSHNGSLLFEIADADGMKHAEKLSPFVEKALTYLQENSLTLDAIAVSAGPGSYTGLRIGASTAKGLCYGFDIPLIAVPTLEILSTGIVAAHAIEKDARLCPMLDARRMEVYTATYTPELELIEEVHAHIVDENSFSTSLNRGKVYFFGNGAEKIKDIVTHENATFIDDIDVFAKNMIVGAEKRFEAKEFVDVAYFEPFYLKEFMATVPKKLI